MSETPQGYQGPLPAYYVQSSTPQTPTLGLTLTGVDPIVAYNFVLIDAASGGSASVSVNGSLVTNPNFNGTTPAAPASNTNVTFQVSGSSVSAYIPTITQGPTGSGTINTFPLWTAATVLGNNTVIATQGAAAVDNATALILTPGSPSTTNAILEIHNQFGSGIDLFTQAAVGNLGRAPNLNFYKSHGASLAAAPLGVAAGDALGIIRFRGYDGSAYGTGVQFEADATETWSGSAKGSRFLIATNVNGSTGLSGCFIALAGVAVTFPAIKRSNANVNFRLADDSADTGIIASIVNATTGFQIAGAAASSNVLRGNGTNFVSSQLAFSDLSGNISVNQMNSGTGASNSTFWRGDGTWVAVGTGTVTSVATTAPLSGGPITTTGTLSITGAAGQVLAGSTPAFTATPVLGTPASASGSLGIANGAAGGDTVTIQAPGITAGNYNFNLPDTAGGSGQVLTSQGGGSSSMTWSTGVPATSCVWSTLTDAAGNLTLANAGFTTTFNQTSAIVWTWANTTAAVVGTPQNAPSHVFSGQYFATGNVTGTDTWTIAQSLTAGLNGASALTITHSGTTGAATVATNNLTLGVSATTAGTLNMFGATGNVVPITTPSGVQLAIGGSVTSVSISAGTGDFRAGSSVSLTSLNGTTRITGGQGAAATNVAQVNIQPTNSLTHTTTMQYGVQCRATLAPTSGTGSYCEIIANSVINQTGGANGTIRCLAAYPVNTALVGTEYLLALGTSSAVGPAGTLTDQFLINNSGVIANYAGTATISQGIPSEIVTIDLTAQAAAIGATNIIASAPRSGMYRISWSATITTVDGAASVLGGANGFQIIYTSPTDSVAKTTVAGASVTSAANTTATAVGGSITVYAKTATAIQYQYGYTSTTPGQMIYELHIKLESM